MCTLARCLKTAHGVELQLDCEKLSDEFRRQFVMSMFAPGQELAMDYDGTKLKVNVEGVSHEPVIPL
jgi:hypothetical protein